VAALNFIFTVCIAVGFAIPLLNILTGWFGGFLDVGADVDLDVDASVGGSGIIPFNVMCLCLFLVVFGATGQLAEQFMTNPLFTVLLLIACFLVAALFYWALYRLLIKRLKDSRTEAMCFRNLRGQTGTVTLRIAAGCMGTISVQDSTGAPISFRARMDPDLQDWMPEVIPKGETVVVTGIDMVNKHCYVSVPFNRMEHNNTNGG